MDAHGKALQVEPMNAVLKAPGITAVKPKCDKVLSRFAFNFKLRRYTTGCCPRWFRS